MSFPADWVATLGQGLKRGSTVRSLRAFASSEEFGEATSSFADVVIVWRDLPGAIPLEPSPITPPGGERVQASFGAGPNGPNVAQAPFPGDRSAQPVASPRANRIMVTNDGTTPLEFSFDGVAVHGRVSPSETREYAERYEGGICFRHGGARAVGTVTAVSGAALVDGDSFVLEDGVNPAVTFEFDNDSSVVETDTLRAIAFTGAETATQVRDLIIQAINAAPVLFITAAEAGADVVGLTNDRAGVAGNIATLESVTHVDFVVTGMGGGTGIPTAFRVEAW